MKALLPLAGQGLRMYPLGITTPKCLLPILNKGLLLWTLEALQQNEIHDCVLVINSGEFGQKIQDYLQGLNMSGATFQLVVQAEQLSTDHVVQTEAHVLS